MNTKSYVYKLSASQDRPEGYKIVGTSHRLAPAGGDELTLQTIYLYKYDSALNKIEEKEYGVKTLKQDTILNKKTTYHYDDKNNKVSIKYESFSVLYPEYNSCYVREYVYDSLGRLIETVNPNGDREVYQYYSNGSLTI